MSYQIVLYIIMLTIFISYVSFIWIKYGVRDSISISYYALPKNYNFLFTLFCWGFSLPAIILGVDVTGFMFLAGTGIMFVGAAAPIKQEFVSRFHSVAAVLGVLGSQLAIFFGYYMWYVNIISLLAIGLILLLLKKNKIWWAEIVAFGAIMYTLGINLILK